ncbi:MAG: hypothetical protein AAF383_29245 [Cyanobacteria bacterium P01_A01_bin.83]
MFSFFKISIRRIIAVFSLSIALFFTVALIGNINAIAAEAITRDVTNLNSVESINDDAYEAMKAGRQREQAARSAMATPAKENEGIVEKLNLDEGLPRSTEKFIDQITGDEPINNKTRP